MMSMQMHSFTDPFLAASLAAGTSIGAAAAVVAQSAVTDGIDPTTGWAGGIIVGGVAVFGFWYRYWVKREKEVDNLRRAVDTERAERISHLEKTVADLHLVINGMHEKYEVMLEHTINQLSEATEQN